MSTLKAGSVFTYTTDTARFRGTVVASGGGFVVGAVAHIATDRSTGQEVDVVGVVSSSPVVLPLDAVEAIA